MIGQRYQKAQFQSDFYRDQYYRMIKILLASIVVMVALIGIILYLVFFKPSSHYYAVTAEGKIIPMTPVKRI